MASDVILRSYGDAARIQDVLPLIEILTARENWFLTNLQKTTARDTVHGVLTDTLRTAASLAVEEAADYTYSANSTPTRRNNIVENIALPFKVSRTQTLIQHFQSENELARQTTKALTDWGNAAEFDILRSTLASGVSGTAPTMSGVLEAISKSTNVTAQTSGTQFSASILKGLLKLNWDNSNGQVVTDLFVGSSLKRDIDTFTAGATKFVMSKEAAVWDYVDVYDGGGFGRVGVHMHRYLNISGTDATGRVLGLRTEKLALAYLEMPHIDAGMARTGDFEPRVVIGKLTLEVRNQDTNFLASGYLL